MSVSIFNPNPNAFPTNKIVLLPKANQTTAKELLEKKSLKATIQIFVKWNLIHISFYLLGFSKLYV